MTDEFLTSREIAYLTQTEHRFVLERACDALIEAGINPNEFWHDYQSIEHGPGKELWLPKREAMISLKSDWYSNKARAAVQAVFETWERTRD